MPIFTDIRPVVMTAGGTGYQMPNTERVNMYVFTGTGTKTASYSITADLANALTTGKPHRVKVWYQGQWTLNPGITIDVFGTVLTSQQALKGNTLFDCLYTGSAWIVQVVDIPVSRSYAASKAVDVSGGASIAVNPQTNGRYLRLTGSGNLAADVTVSMQTPPELKDGEDFVVDYEATLGNPTPHSVTIFDVTLTDDEIKAGNVRVWAYWDLANSVLVVKKSYNTVFVAGVKEVITLQTSFETDEAGAVIFNIPYNCKITNIQTCVNKTVAGTDNGLIAVDTTQENATPLLAVTIPMSSAVGSITNNNIASGNIITAGDTLTLTASKTTVGGRVQCMITLLRTT